MQTVYDDLQYELAYAHLVQDILSFGEKRQTRNAPTRATFGKTLRINELRKGYFPILKGRKIFYKGVLGELAAFFNEPSSVADFEKQGCNYWKQWADEDGNLELDYGNSWFNWDGINQMKDLVEGLKNNPNDRRHIVTGWNPSRLSEVSLPCCHILYQWYVTNDGYLDMVWYQRSVDVMVGLPSDVILAAAMNIVIAQLTGYKPGSLIFMLGDTHIYQSHSALANEYVSRVFNEIAVVKDTTYSYEGVKEFRDFTKDSIKLNGYVCMSPLKFEVHP